MHGKMFQSRCERGCGRPPFDDDWTLERRRNPALPLWRKNPVHICWFDETPFEMERIGAALVNCTVFMAVGTSGVVEPAASFVRLCANPWGQSQSYYVGPEEPANRAFFDEVFSAHRANCCPSFFAMD